MTNKEAKSLLNNYFERINELKCMTRILYRIGSITTFGTFEGKPLEWIIISKTTSMMTLLAKDIICCMEYNEEHENITWEECTLRKWLNGEFYNFFSNKEKNRIIKTRVKNKDTNFDVDRKSAIPDNAKHHILGGNDTDDYVYLLSIDEAKSLTTDILKTTDWWWLRTPGCSQDNVALVDDGGSVNSNGDWVNNELGVRPVLNLKF